MWKKKRRKVQFAFNAEKVFLAATQPLAAVYSYFQTNRIGLSADEVEKRQSLYGRNEVEHEKKKNPVSVFIKAFINPFIGVLTGLVITSFILDVLLAEPGEQDWTAIVIISVMVVASAILRFCQEWKANASSEALLKMVTNTCYVRRVGRNDEEINIAELVPDDLVMIAAGDMIPADLRIVEAKDLFVSQSALTGESDPVEKHTEVKGKKYAKGSVVELDNICYMGSNVVSGSAIGIVFATGNNTYLGTRTSGCHGVRPRHQSGQLSADSLHAGHDTLCFPGEWTDQGRLAGGFHLCHFRSGGSDARNVAHDCHGQPFQGCRSHVAQEDHSEGPECHTEFWRHEHTLHGQDWHADL